MSDWLWAHRLMPWQIAMRLRLYRFRRCVYTEYRVLPYGVVDGEMYWDHRHSKSFYWTPIGVWLHPWKMRRVEREVEELLK